MPGIQLNHKFSDGSLASAKAKRKDKRKSVVPRRNNSLFSFNLHPRDIYEYFKSLGFHLKRAIVHDLTAEMATENERMLLKHTLGVVERGTTNLLAWRRSTLGLAMFGTVLTWLFQVQGAFDSHDEWQHIEFLAFQNTTYNATQDFNIRDYFERVAKSTGAAAMRDVALARVYCAIALVIIIFFSIITLFMAAQCWDRYSQSRKLMLLTWLLAFAAPFGISTVPMRSFVRYVRDAVLYKNLWSRRRPRQCAGGGSLAEFPTGEPVGRETGDRCRCCDALHTAAPHPFHPRTSLTHSNVGGTCSMRKRTTLSTGWRCTTIWTGGRRR